ncbi:response regulator [Flavobacterium sp. 7A]|uniref:response regulator n=1 Tax=Flavobacterium sp. 7A TaxID=2940571 RepID=UPI002226B3FD|nr:response regulator [Flavobacterium sp. 7A]MCW2119499.1 CheY-like chemotaxis protein [Flavobacterium sp. 7A]
MLNKIFCVDDDPITLMLCKKVISKMEFSKETVTAKNGEEALQYYIDSKKDGITTNLPQLIFLDLNMPVMGGWEFLDSFCKDEFSEFNNTPIVVLSSTIDPADLEKTKKYPMVIDFLSKPISFAMLDYLSQKLV